MKDPKDLPEKRMFHRFSLQRITKLSFWKGQFLCRLFGHRVNQNGRYPWCGRCGLAYEEFYGLGFYDHFTVIPDCEGEIDG